ncbi:Leucine-responsive regulatory protein [Roseomonas mucosa]|mgnify:CR=1 FL=1|jgi:Lrp/AsnC family transcriptional regulator, leucine-responsive regulatory protein|uniref:ArsR family transcriptional regulator n=1 Tax=Roseomonas mucosa TaxID=207340 RepID=A0A1S8DAN0_9PROT|nr:MULTISPECIES: Lrp/AsnC ligand binding domain-containing protein [Roseomonas]MBS5904187.1 Lrp/AsnC ligand binding domain-containing protein [Acetobacteraceae bacterium]MDT8264303.1 Lrp/AsnC ligand binding domain-containing protein [Roseomonas sp. DSM 102946]ATR22065.1 ArsR family transcriptional regulator [Roseomonas sp. FDAARGOS_362]AWV21155.1 Leucine-responsive regulatory protein [Roseomonas mucosa]MCG7351578.1 Lrp/AsnC ligand binding domain-containing protein [Roseomonas mucosa]
MDEIDKRLLRLLQRDGRMTNVELARQAHLSPPATHERIRRLQQDGVIEGYSVRLNAGKLQRALLIFVEVTLDRTSARVFEDFGAAVRRTPEIMECHMVAGGFDYLIKVRVRDMAAYRHFLGTVLVGLPGIRQTHTYTVMEEVKNTTEFAID